MKKPEYTKPFDLEHAKAGAPFAGEHGEAVRVLIWDRKHPTHPIIAIEEDGDQEAIAFSKDGSTAHNYDSIVRQLVMLPLGFIDGKPVFVGDELAWNSETIKALPGWKPADMMNCAWPAPAPVYPTFDGSVDMLAIEFDKGAQFRKSLVHVANFALRHAIDAGQVVLPGGGGMAAELVRAQELVAKMRQMLERDAARDLAVAQAVVAAVVETVAPMKMPAIGRTVQRLDLSAIIAGVAK